MDNQEYARAERARMALGRALDDIELTFYPDNIGRVLARSLTRSRRRHAVAWGVAGAAAVAMTLGAAVWALLSAEDKR